MDQNSSLTDVRVLLVDDDEEDYLIIQHLFGKIKGANSVLDWASSSDEAIEVINRSEHDIYLIDYRLDARTGLDVLREVNAIEREEPFILLTGVGDHGIEQASLKLAASDYLVKKNLSSDSLARAIYYALGRKEQERQKIDQLIELNRTKDEFISIASHQLRTPVTTVKQYVAMVLDGMGGDLNETQRNFLQKAYDSNERQLSIINDLLKVAQIDAGSMELSLAEVNISQVLKDTITDFQPAYEQAGQKLLGDIPPELYITADENALRMVIDNLLDNAKKYSEFGSTTRLSIEQKEESTEIRISDEGVGIEFPERLFEKFSRINNKLSTEVGGTGLGLYWARSIARLHGGDLEYENNTTAGSTFVLTLPNM